mmetsp:Transcript_103489/g.298051  ORF Transcript_103489/g.298051 Transcript_103489/m.298051 type:complete len:218 (-) Transcript_103489:614-1267(-)
MAMILSKPIFLPRKANEMRSSCGRSARMTLAMPCLMAARARARKAIVLARTWTKALGLGSVALNNSKASSSFNTLIVSASATSSSARTLLRSSHSALRMLHCLRVSSCVFVSAAKSDCVVDKSLLAAASASSLSPLILFFSSHEACLAVRIKSRACFSKVKALMAFVSSAVIAVNSSSNFNFKSFNNSITLSDLKAYFFTCEVRSSLALSSGRSLGS